MAPSSCAHIYLAVHGYHRCYDEPLRFLLYAVRAYYHCSTRVSLNVLTRLSLKHVAEAGSLAEEVISTVRTAQAFGTQTVLSALYEVFVHKARTVDMKAAWYQGAGIAIFFFVIYSAYALGEKPD